MSRIALHGTVMINGVMVPDQIVLIENKKIVTICPPDTASKLSTDTISYIDGFIVPGYIDLHIHGSNGFDVMDASEEAMENISDSLANYGVTSFLATTMTSDLDHLEKVICVCRKFGETQLSQGMSGARMLGIHLEGPWINSYYKGAQNERHVVAPTNESVSKLVDAGGGWIRVVTLAPEVLHSTEVIAYLKDHQIISSIGHSNALYEEVKAAIDKGLSHVTHCYNAMRGLHHREPGVVGAALYHNELTTELIADGVHVHPVVMNILYRAKSAEGIVLVSDGIRAVGVKDGLYDLGGLDVYVKDGNAHLSDGTLAGSTLTLDKAVKNVISLCGVTPADAIVMASETPARIVGFGNQLGRISPGYDADINILDCNFKVIRTMIQGKWIN